MAKISFETFQETVENSSSNDYSVKLFSLKNDGDEALVRIMHDSTADFDIMTCHPIKIGNNYRKVSCIRDPKDPIDNCPFCKAGNKIQQRFFIHMIEYVPQENGTVVPTPVIWERTAKEYATKLNTLINEYGPLSDRVFKIRRNGKAGDMQTTYEIMFVDPTRFNDSSCPKVPNAFDNYSVLGTIVMDKNAEEINQFLATGNFPEKKPNTSSAPNTTVNSFPMVDDTPTMVPNNQPSYPTPSPFAAQTTVPWEPSNTPTTPTPTRYY